MKPEPFRIDVPESALDDLRERLARVRWPGDFANSDWGYGVPRPYLESLVAYWRQGFDWRAREAEMNAFAHFRVTLDGIPIHFVHERGRGPNPLPLVLTHGWPWTFWDFGRMIRPLVDPAAHGGDPADSFDVVVPSLPGFGFSSPLEVAGVDCARTAELWDRLMRESLGYARYGAHGGDWGALVTAHIGHRYADHVVGVQETLPVVLDLDPGSIRPGDYGPGEEDWSRLTEERRHTITSHVAVHREDPQTLAYALHDSPVGLAAWIVERRRAWSDCGGDVEKRFSRDDLLTTVSLYWLTGTIGTSMRYYKENFSRPFRLAHDRKPAIEAPAGFVVFPRDVVLLPRKAVERHANLRRWTVMPRGGHFGPAEEPELLVDEVRAFFRPLRRGRA